MRARVVRWGLSLPAVAALCACASMRPPVDNDVEPFDAVRPNVDVAAMDRRPPATTSPYPTWDLSVVLPYNGPVRTSDLTMTASAGRVDVHLAIDTTASFNGEIQELQRALLTTVVPGLRTRVQSLTVGVSSFQDMPFEPFGARSDFAFRLFTAQTSDWTAVSSGVRQLNMPLGMGGDRPEAWIEALYQIATGEGLGTGLGTLIQPFRPAVLPDTGTVPGVGFRPNSTRVVVLVTDAPPHDAPDYAGVVTGVHSWVQAQAALRRIGARVVGIASAPDARSLLDEVAIATGAVAPPVAGRCDTGLNGAPRDPRGTVCPLVYEIASDGRLLSRTIVDGMVRLLDTAVYAEAHGEESEDPRGFVRAIEALQGVPPAMVVAPGREDRRPTGTADGVADTFTQVHARTQLTFRMHFANRSVPEQERPQTFFVRVVIWADGLILRELVVRVIVPEGPKDGGPDARLDAVPTETGAGEGGTDMGFMPDVPETDAVDDLAPADAAPPD